MGLSLRFLRQTPVCTSALPHSCCMPPQSHYLITGMIFGNKYKSYDILLSPITSSRIGPHIFLSALFSNTCTLCSSRSVRPCFTPIHNRRQNYSSVYFSFCDFFNSEDHLLIHVLNCMGATRWRSWLRHCATRRRVAGSIPDGVIGIIEKNLSGRAMALRSTQPLTEMSTRNIY